ncbi:Aspartate racemase [Castellaniella denitrificans]|uniref:aspartate/glutamate racemase family protein n=1 Tax=Castellaniella sp. TaxID=1955812 RepID=UPI002AFFC8DA|nr:amino acid racemase [Castellaniella sp.]
MSGSCGRRWEPRLGVLGGMGPLAGAACALRIVQLTSATRDQEHIAVVLLNDPHVPDRSSAYMAGGQSPLPAMLRGVNALVGAGADCIVVPCNTAHLWFDQLQQACPRPILHIVDAVIDDLRRRGIADGTVGVLGTPATLELGLYQDRLVSSGYRPMIPRQAEIQSLLVPAIAAVKANRVSEAYSSVARAIESLGRRGARAIVLGCTELPLAVPHERRPELGIVLTDSIDALALQAIEWMNRYAGTCAA